MIYSLLEEKKKTPKVSKLVDDYLYLDGLLVCNSTTGIKKKSALSLKEYQIISSELSEQKN